MSKLWEDLIDLLNNFDHSLWLLVVKGSFLLLQISIDKAFIISQEIHKFLELIFVNSSVVL